VIFEFVTAVDVYTLVVYAEMPRLPVGGTTDTMFKEEMTLTQKTTSDFLLVYFLKTKAY
jgi:hypothetical protein